MNHTRRTVLKGVGATVLLQGLIAAGLLRPTQVLAAEWNKAAFEAKDTAGAIKGLGAGATADSKDLTLRVPDIAENGLMVQVDVVSAIPHTTSISVLVEKNPFPLSAHFDLTNGALPDVSIRVKMAQTSVIKAVAKADGKFYTAQKEVKVTAGGCGG